MGRAWLFAAVMVVLAACGSLPKPETRRASETFISVTDSRFPGPPFVIFATDRFCSEKQSAVWRGDAGLVEILVVEADQGCILNLPLEGEETIALNFKWLKKTGIRFDGPAIKTDTPLGVIWGRRFKRENRNCYFFRHAFEAHHFSNRSYPTTFMMGYFCAQPGEQQAEESIHRLVSSISLSDAPAVATAAMPEIKAKPDGTLYPYSPERDVSYTISGRWVGVAELVTGRFEYKRQAKTGRFDLDVPGKSEICRGEWQRTYADANDFTRRARWRVDCPGLPSATGTFSYGSLQTADMYGKDDDDHFMQFTLLAPKEPGDGSGFVEKEVPIEWDGVISDRMVTVRYANAEGPDSLSFEDADKTVSCKGDWYLDGRWSAACSNGRKITGKSFRFQFGTILGTGRDDLGRKFRFGNG
jgi:hypothetical protein